MPDPKSRTSPFALISFGKQPGVRKEEIEDFYFEAEEELRKLLEPERESGAKN